MTATNSIATHARHACAAGIKGHKFAHCHTMNCTYVRENYGVPAEIGRRVTVNGKPGIIAADRGHYIGVNFDHHKPGDIRNAHPTSEVQYLEMGQIRKMTRSQARYQRWLDVGECFDSFRHFLAYESAKARESAS